MKFDDLEARLRIHETGHDAIVLPRTYVVARIDGRGFTQLTRKKHRFDAPYDVRVRDMMIATTAHLMECGFKVVYGYTQSDEISLLFHRDDDSFNRKVRKWVSILAGEASACFSLALGAHAAFDARLSLLPDRALVVDYFRWRHEDAHRNALHGHCYWRLRAEGLSERAATEKLEGLGISDRNELLFSRGINFDTLPTWQKRGVGLSFAAVEKKGKNPKTGAETLTTRRRIVPDFELPLGDAYTRYVDARVALATPSA